MECSQNNSPNFLQDPRRKVANTKWSNLKQVDRNSSNIWHQRFKWMKNQIRKSHQSHIGVDVDHETIAVIPNDTSLVRHGAVTGNKKYVTPHHRGRSQAREKRRVGVRKGTRPQKKCSETLRHEESSHGMNMSGKTCSLKVFKRLKT